MERKINYYLFIVFMLLISCAGNQESVVHQKEVSIIPEPLHMEVGGGEFKITDATKIIAEKGNAEAVRIAMLLADRLNISGGFSINVEEGMQSPSNAIFFTTNETDRSLGEEGYSLSVNKDAVVVKALKPAGLFYGLQSLYQLLPPEIESPVKVDNVNWALPSIEVTDTPRYSWRGLHLDVSRHFMPVEFIKKYIDNMAMHKLNTFHWHLT
ncbi:MAG TPA: glycoside hydrolase family 20 zincin-like fold domain-containing protein, partial [Cytophagaceae bacterium]